MRLAPDSAFTGRPLDFIIPSPALAPSHWTACAGFTGRFHRNTHNSQSHWIYLALPRLADWVQGRFVDAAALYRALQTAEFEIGFDYAAAYQPITAALARTLIADRAGLLARAPLDDTADLAARLPADPAAIIPSEFAFCTVWCCKAKSA